MEKKLYASILSGRQKSLFLTTIRLILSILTYPYMAVLIIRNALYDFGIIKIHNLPAATISIGNITTGGTGKTPLVELTAKYIKDKKGKKVAILSRGYGGQKASKTKENILNENGQYKANTPINDEYCVLRDNLVDVLILTGKDRVQNGKRAINDYNADCILLDDGFQHLRLKRDLDIVIIDALNPFAEEQLIPRGLLREPVKNLVRADLFILSHCDHVSAYTLETIYKKLNQINPNTPICEAIHKPVHIEDIKGGYIARPEWLKGKRIYGVCAIGNPGSFATTIKKLGADLIKFKTYNDHHIYSQKEIDTLTADAKALKADAIATTQKDIVKIRNLKDNNNSIIITIKIEMEITKGIEHYERAIEKALIKK